MVLIWASAGCLLTYLRYILITWMPFSANSLLTAMDWLDFPKLMCWSLNSQCDLICRQCLYGTHYKCGLKGWALTQWDVSLQEQAERAECPLSPLTLRKGYVSTQWMRRWLSVCQESPHQNLIRLALRSQIPSPYNGEAINFCCLSHPACAASR